MDNVNSDQIAHFIWGEALKYDYSDQVKVYFGQWKGEIVFVIEFGYSAYEASDDNLEARTEAVAIKFIIQSNVNGSNTVGSFTIASFFESLQNFFDSSRKQILTEIFLFITKLYVMCTH